MATNDSNRRRWGGTVPEAPPPMTPSEETAARQRQASPPAAAPMPTVGQRLRDAVASFPREVASYARDVARDPLREAELALAPLPGAGRGVSLLRATAGAARPAAGVSMTYGAPGLRRAQALATPAPGAMVRRGIGSGMVAGSAGLALGQVDSAQPESPAAAPTRPRSVSFVDPNESESAALARARTQTGDPRVAIDSTSVGSYQVGDGPVRHIRMTPTERRAAADVDRLEPVVASGNRAPDAYQTTRRTVRDIDLAAQNTRGRSLYSMMDLRGVDGQIIQRAINAAQFHGRGSPSMRKAIMDAYLGGLDTARRADLEGLRGQTDALTDGAAAEVAADESFAGRRDTANMFNTETAERRRIGDRRDMLDLMRLQAASLAAEDQRATAISDRYDAYRQEWLESHPGDHEGATNFAADMARREGLVNEREVPQGRAAAIQQSAALERAFQDNADGGFLGLRGLGDRIQGLDRGDPRKGGSVTFDPDEWEARRQTFWQRLGSRVRPGVTADDPIYRHRRTGQEVFLRSSNRDPRRHERTANERDPRRPVRRQEDR